MKVRLYIGALKLVEKSGVGQAVHHQQAMLRRVGVPVAFHSEPDVDIVHINTVFPESVAAAILAKLRGQTVVYYGHSTMEDFRNSFRCSNLLVPLFKCWIKLCYSIGDVVVTPTGSFCSATGSAGRSMPCQTALIPTFSLFIRTTETAFAQSTT